MSTSRETPNPLRPYYKPPSIGILPDAAPGPSAASTGRTHGLGSKNGSAASYASSAREIFLEYDYSDYLSDSSPSSFETMNRHVNDWMHRYFGALLAQPFDVAKMILQVRNQTASDGGAWADDVSLRGRERNRSQSGLREEVCNDYYPEDQDSDPDELSYFTSSALSSNRNFDSFSHSRRRPDHGREYSPPPPKTLSHVHQLILKKGDSLLEVISQEWTKEGAWGVWKGSNSTFIYGIIHETVERWVRGMLSAIFNVPDSGLTAGVGIAAELVDSPYPWASLGVAIAAAVSAGILLAPLDLVRTKLILTPTTSPSRSLTHQVRHLPSYLCPSSLLIPTALHSLIKPTLHHTTPLVLRSHLSLDPVLTPSSYSLAKFLSRTLELFLKLPFETVLRRGQMSVLAFPDYTTTSSQKPAKLTEELKTVVQIGEYRGVVGTMWCIVREEGTREVVGKNGKKVVRKGQGVEGLWRGWRVGMWGLVGVWGAGALGGKAGGEF